MVRLAPGDQRAGLVLIQDFSAHSLRAGFVTETHRNGTSESDIAQQTGHKSLEMVRRYIRDADRGQLAAARTLKL